MVERSEVAFLSEDKVVAHERSMEALRCEGVFHEFLAVNSYKERIWGRWKETGFWYKAFVPSEFWILSIVHLVY